MAPPTHRSQVQKLQSELSRSKRWRSDEGYDDLWTRMVDMYRGKHYSEVSDDDRLVINMAFATKNVIAPSVSVNNPKFLVKPRKAESAATAVHATEILNHVWQTNKYKKQFRRAVDDFLMIGHGWLKVGYKFVKEDVVQGNVVGGTAEYGDGEDEGIADRDETMPGNVETEIKVLDDRPFAERISFKDMFVDPDARSMDEARWIAQRVRRPVADVRVDDRYDKKVRKAVAPSMKSRFDDGAGGMAGVDGSNVPGAQDAGFVDVWEWYDIKRNTMCVFADGNLDGFLISPKKIDYAFGHPFLMLRNYEIPDFFYPMGELEAMEGLQTELNETRSQMFNHRKRYARKWVYAEDAFDPTGLAALESDADNTMVPVAKGYKLVDAIQPMPSVGTPPDFYNQSEMIEQDINTVTATSDYQRGDMPSIRRTATEAAMLQDASNARSADKLNLIEEFLAEVGERIVALLQQFMTQEQTIRLIGMDQQPVWLNYDAEYIQGDFDFEVEAGSTQPQNESFKRQAAMQLTDAMAPYVGAGVVDMAKLATFVLREFGVKNPESFIMAPPPPMDPMGGEMGPEGPMDPEGQLSPEGVPPMGPMG